MLCMREENNAMDKNTFTITFFKKKKWGGE